MAKTVTVLAREWVSLAEATVLIGKSERSVQRLAKAGDVRWTLEDGKRVYHSGDLARAKDDGVKTKREPEAGPQSKALVLRSSATSATTPCVGVTEKLWLSLEEAAEYSGLSESFLMGRIETGEIAGRKAGPHGSWRLRRASLEGFEG